MAEKQGHNEETKQKFVAGFPVNWDWKNWSKGLWNPQDDTLFPPKKVGVGWTINFHAMLKKLRLIR